MIANTKRNFSQCLIYFLVYFLVYFLGVQEPSSLSHASRHVTQNCYTRLCVDICYIFIQVYEGLFTVMLACDASDSDRSGRDASKSGKKKLEKEDCGGRSLSCVSSLSRACLHSLVRVFSLSCVSSLSLVRVFSLSPCSSSCRAPAMQATVMYGFYTVVSIFLFLYGYSEIKL